MASAVKKLAFQCGRPYNVSRDEIRQRRIASKENDPDWVHLCSRNPLQDLNASPPPGKTFVEFRAASASITRDPLLAELQEELRLMKETFREKETIIETLKKKNEDQEVVIRMVTRKCEERELECRALEAYQDLQTTRDQVAASLLNDISVYLDKHTISTKKKIAKQLKQEEERMKNRRRASYGAESLNRRVSHAAFQHATAHVSGYKKLIRTYDGMKNSEKVGQNMMKQLAELIEGVEASFFEEHSSFDLTLSAEQLRDAMRKFYKLDGVKMQRDLGAHLFDMTPRSDLPASFLEQRKRKQWFAIADIQDAVKNKTFKSEHLHEDSVSETLLAACEIHLTQLRREAEMEEQR